MENAAADSSSGPKRPVTRIDTVCVEFCKMYDKVTGMESTMSEPTNRSPMRWYTPDTPVHWAFVSSAGLSGLGYNRGVCSSMFLVRGRGN